MEKGDYKISIHNYEERQAIIISGHDGVNKV